MNLPNKCLVDTNVPKMANRALQSDDNISPEEHACVLACIDAVEHVINNDCLVIDNENKNFYEYLGQLSLSGQPGMGDSFMKWVHDHCWGPKCDRIKITRNNSSYDEFPDTNKHPGLKNFDPSDRKFVAVANAHPDKPPILQATDSKWWGWKDALAKAGIEVHFLCECYIKAKYEEKGL